MMRHSKSTDLLRIEEVDPPSSIGKIRQSVAIDANGNLAVAYGEYSGIMTVLTYDVQNNRWHKYQTLSNPDQDSLMYCYVELVDLDEFYTLCVQDTSRDGETYYQYVKLFAYESGVWSDYMVVDYRDHPIASKESHMVEHTEFKRIDGKLHIITRSNPLSEVRHFIYESHQITELTTTLKGRNGWVRLLNVNETLYYVTTKLSFLPMVEIVEVETGKVVYQAIGMAMGSYLYLGEAMTSGEIAILFYPGWDMRYESIVVPRSCSSGSNRSINTRNPSVCEGFLFLNRIGTNSFGLDSSLIDLMECELNFIPALIGKDVVS
ncbi:MAG: hypothetical protein MZU97_06090 [Bacillus subtilis]|nr:hypothetical protein [Bacillus subtilis]